MWMAPAIETITKIKMFVQESSNWSQSTKSTNKETGTGKMKPLFSEYFEKKKSYVAQAGLELIETHLPLPLPLESNCAPPCPAL